MSHMSYKDFVFSGPLGPGSDEVRTAVRGIDDLRRGWAIRLVSSSDVSPFSQDGSQACDLICVAAETLTPSALTMLRSLGPVYSIITRNRARFLRVGTAVDPAVMVAMPDGETAEQIRLFGNPTEDLEHPLRGPYRATPCRAARVPDGLPGAVLDLLKKGRLLPCAVAVPITRETRNESGLDTDANLTPGIQQVETGDVQALLAAEYDDMLHKVIETPVQLAQAESCRIAVFRPQDGGQEHLALIIGNPDLEDVPLVRIHSACLTGDIFDSLRCDCGPQLRQAFQIMGQTSGLILYLQQEGRGIGLLNKMRTYALQDQGFDTVDANEHLGFENDERTFSVAIQMLRALQVSRVRLLTNNPHKVQALSDAGISVIERISHYGPHTEYNRTYLETKIRRSGHFLPDQPEKKS